MKKKVKYRVNILNIFLEYSYLSIKDFTPKIC